MFITVAGASGCGKTTIISAILERFADKIATLPSSTTRSMREGEIEGKFYFYLTKEEFEEAIARGEFIEYEKVHANGNYYGVSRLRYEQYIKNFPILIKDIDVKGVRSLKRAGIDVVSIYVDVPSAELRERLIKRGEKPEEIEIRLSRKEFEDSFKGEYDYVIENIVLEDAIEKTAKIICNEAKKRNIILN